MVEKEEKEYFIGIMVIDMKEIGKMERWMEKVYIIIIMVNGKVIDMKEIGKKIKEKEVEYIIEIMEIGKWEIT